MKDVIWYVCAGTRGGPTRIKILHFLQETPANAHQIAEQLQYDYKTIRHHLKLLEKNQFIYQIEKTYGGSYFLTEQFKAHIGTFTTIMEKSGLNLGKH